MMEEYIEDGYASPTAQAQSEPDILLSIKHEDDEEDSAGGLGENKKFFELTPVELGGLQYEEPETFPQDDCEPPQHPPAAMPQQTETNTVEDRSSQQRRMPGRWTEDATLRFIKVYRQYDCLWDVKSPQYRNKAVRDQGFAALAASADLPGFTAADAKNKIKNLRSTYTQELRKVRASNGAYQPTLTWYREADAFLGPLIAPRMVTSDLQQQGVSGEVEEVVMNEMEDTLEGSPTAAAPSPSSDRIPTSPSDTPSQHGNTNKKRKKLSTVPGTTYLSEDEFDAFGRSVAAQLKKFSLAGALRTQVKIQSLLTQERLSDSIHNLTCSCQQLEEPTANDILTQAVNSILPQD